MQILLAITYADSNTPDAVAEHCIPMLGEWEQKGALIEQHVAAELFILVSGRFDLTHDLIANGALPKLVSLFMAIDDIEAKPDRDTQGEHNGRLSARVPTAAACRGLRTPGSDRRTPKVPKYVSPREAHLPRER